MRIYSRFFLSLVVYFFAQQAFPQEKEILLVGTAHNFENTNNQHFEKVVDKLADFKPQIICIEAIPVWDTVSQQKILPKDIQRVIGLMAAMGLTSNTIIDSLNYYRKKTLEKKISPGTWTKLGFYYFLNRDFGCNSNYNWFRAVDAYSGNMDPSDTLVQQYLQSEKKTEFHNVIFPVAVKLGLRQLYGVDDRSTYPDDINAQNETQSKLMNLPKGKEKIAVYMKIQADYAAAEKAGTVFNLINDTTYQQTISDLITNIYPGVTTDESARKMKELWEKRNLSIAGRIVTVIKENNYPQRILVTFGAAHIPLLKKYLERLGTGYRIVLFHQL